jgi:hypothetical protein
VGYLPAAATVLDEDMLAVVRHLPGYREQLFRFLPVHTGSYNFKVQQEV